MSHDPTRDPFPQAPVGVSRPATNARDPTAVHPDYPAHPLPGVSHIYGCYGNCGGTCWSPPGSTTGNSSTAIRPGPDADVAPPRARIAELEGLLREALPVIDPAADGCRVWRAQSIRRHPPECPAGATTDAGAAGCTCDWTRPECACVACRIRALPAVAPPVARVEWRDDEAGPRMAGFVREAAEPRNAAWMVTLSTGADPEGRVTTCALISRQDSPLFDTPAEARAWSEALLARCPQ